MVNRKSFYGTPVQVPYNPAKVGLELKRIKVKLRQPSQREDQRTPTCHSLPQFKHIGHSDWANLRKSSLARIRLLPDYTVLVQEPSQV